MRRLAILCVFLAFSCYSTQRREPSIVKNQRLTDEENARLEKYTAFNGDFLIDRLAESDAEFMKIEPATKAYEGALMLRLFGLDDLPLDAQAKILGEFFDRIPQDEDVAAISNFVFPKWFATGEPFIFCATKVVVGKKTPAVSALTNVVPLLRKMGADKVKKTPATFIPYPKLDFQDGRKIEYAGDICTFVIGEDGRVSASKMAGKVCDDPFDELSPQEKIALADDYLRDSDLENDGAAAGEMEKIFSDKSASPQDRFDAAKMLFAARLFGKGESAAQNLIAEVRALPEFASASEETKKFFSATAPNIAALAKRFKAGAR